MIVHDGVTDGLRSGIKVFYLSELLVVIFALFGEFQYGRCCFNR